MAGELYEKTKANFIRYGLHRVNRFKVSIPLPKDVAAFLDNQSSTNNGIIPTWASSAINYGLIALGMNSKGDHSIDFYCRATDLPGTQLATEEMKINGNTFKYVSGLERDFLNFTFQVPKDFLVKQIFDRWKAIQVNEQSRMVGYAEDYMVDVEISALDQQDNVVYAVKIIEAYPVTYGSIQLNKMSSDLGSSMDVSFAFLRVDTGTITDTNQSVLPGSIGGIVEGLTTGNIEQAAYSTRMLLMQAQAGNFTGEAAALYSTINSVVTQSSGFSAAEMTKAGGKLKTMVNTSTNVVSDVKQSLTNLIDGLL
jgi:hypothetical protein